MATWGHSLAALLQASTRCSEIPQACVGGDQLRLANRHYTLSAAWTLLSSKAKATQKEGIGNRVAPVKGKRHFVAWDEVEGRRALRWGQEKILGARSYTNNKQMSATTEGDAEKSCQDQLRKTRWILAAKGRKSKNSEKAPSKVYRTSLKLRLDPRDRERLPILTTAYRWVMSNSQSMKKNPLHDAGVAERVRGEQKHWGKPSDTQAPNLNTGQGSLWLDEIEVCGVWKPTPDFLDSIP